MFDYREILRYQSLGYSQQQIEQTSEMRMQCVANRTISVDCDLLKAGVPQNLGPPIGGT